jgi:hypothetical protein
MLDSFISSKLFSLEVQYKGSFLIDPVLQQEET